MPRITSPDLRFAAAVNCMDGRCQDVVAWYMKGRYGVHYVDAITDAGVVRLLAEGDPAALESVRRRLEISVDRHGSECVAVCGHHDCAGNPCDRATHEGHIRAACELVRSWALGVELVGLYINELWQAEVVCGFTRPAIVQPGTPGF